MDKIIIKGAREHNLKNVNLEIPKNKLVVFTGLSGSGKSSLAFDTIYAEGQRRYVESLSSYARQFLGIMKKPDVDAIIGLSPAISIDQKSTSHNPRSTVGTITEIYDYLRLLFARIGHPHCSQCHREVASLSKEQITESIFTRTTQKIMLLAPLVKDRKGEYLDLFIDLKKQGYKKVRIDGKFFLLSEQFTLIKTNKHTIDVVIDALVLTKTTDRERVQNDVEQGLKFGNGELIVSRILDKSFSIPEKPKQVEDTLYSEKFACPNCGISIPEIEPRIFSFNTPHGACMTCNGLGTILTIDADLVFNNNLSINEGGILPFQNIGEQDTWFSRTFKTFCNGNNISVTTRLSDMPKDKKDLILYGTGETEYEVLGKNRFGKETLIYQPFKGIMHELKARHQETESIFLKSMVERFMRYVMCPDCNGTRLKKEALSVTVNNKSIIEVSDMPINAAYQFIDQLTSVISKREEEIGKLVIKEIKTRLGFLQDVGLEYLTLSRGAQTLSGGEAQRIRLASQIGSGLTGVLYVLDEPSIGLHQRDNQKLITTLKKLRDLGNTVIVVEHDEETMRSADFLVDFGPGAGFAGGNVVAHGTPEEVIQNHESLTGKYLSGGKKIKVVPGQGSNDNNVIIIYGAKEHNLKNIDVSFPLGRFIVVTGVSGSGKSTLVHDILYHALMQKTNTYHKEKPGSFSGITGDEFVRNIFLIDQSPIGRTPRSNPITYTGCFSYIRDLFASTKEAKRKGYGPGRFSFNVKGGRCEACEGEGQIKIEMQFLPDVYVTCEVCNSKQYTSDTLDITYNGKTIADILQMSVEEALSFFSYIPILAHKLQILNNVGLSYIKLGQPAPTLSGGEAQRVKLAAELAKKGKDAVYILDEPTSGLHFADLEKLLFVLRKLVDLGNTVIVIEHNLDVIKNADHIIDLGPEGGEKGGSIITTGTPREIAQNKHSYTGQFLKDVLSWTM